MSKEKSKKFSGPVDSPIYRVFQSPDYNMVFTKFKPYGYKKLGGYQEPDFGMDFIEHGQLLRWGRTPDDDPDFCKYGPEIADIEISSGRCNSGCPFCYKENGPNEALENMPFEVYKNVLDKIAAPGILTQVALGLTSVKDHPDLLRIMRYTRNKGIFANFTISGSDDSLDYEMAVELADLCGALAVSVTPWNYEQALDKVQLFSSLGVEQTNIHVVVSAESMDFVNKVIDARMTDPRLANMNAVVCLMIKPKGRAVGKFHPPAQEDYQKLVEKAISNNVPIGFDSCSANRFLDAINKMDLEEGFKQQMREASDPCESTCFSIYVNCKGEVTPCSFCEDEPQYKPINLVEIDDFVKDVWMSDELKSFRKTLIQNNRSCPAFPSINI